MPAAISKSFETPDELRKPPLANVAMVDLEGAAVARLTLEPGWRWAESVKPIVGTESCLVHHLGVLASGTMHVVASDGSEYEIGPGSAYTIEPGHDAWVVGDRAVVAYEFDSATAARYATSTD